MKNAIVNFCKNLKVYLDDERETPEGFHRTYTVEETIEFIKANNGHIHTISLDNDLGSGYKEGREVLNWLEEQAFNGTILPIKYIIIHTGNSYAMQQMMQARYNCFRYWKKKLLDI